MSKTICYYHDDLDGIASAAIVRRALGKEVELREAHYGISCSEDIEEGSHVIFVDFSPRDEEDFDKLKELNCKVTIIDHHQTALDVFSKRDDWDGIIDVTKAGCHHTWEFFFPEEAMPVMVDMIGKYDIWDHEDPRVLPTYYGMMLIEQDPTNDDMWNDLFAPQTLEKDEHGMAYGLTPHEQIMNMGTIALLYKEQSDEHAMRKAHIIDFHGVKTVVMNDDVADSYAFDSFFANTEKAEGVTAMMWYYRTKKGQWKYSLRSAPGTDTDVRSLAEKYPGGGGHRGSAGFISDELLSEIIEA